MSHGLSFDGAFTALATPFRDGSLDLQSYDKLLSLQLDGGITGVVPCGTTGESPTVEESEFDAIVELSVRRAKGRAMVIAGTGSNSTREAIHRTRRARELGADAAMIVMPYYNRPTQAGMIAHVRAVHDASDIPIVLYNVPARTASDLAAESVVEIARHCPRVVALKEATGNVLRTQQVVGALGSRIAVLSGDDSLTVGIMACGGRGVISVTSNVAPSQIEAVVRAMNKGDLAAARERHLALMPLHDVMFIESNPAPVKAALALLGIGNGEVRLPLVAASEQSVAKVRSAMVSAGLLK